MDNLTSLSNQLPKQKLIEQELKEIDATIVQEFKTAAQAVTRLFKLSGAKAALARDEGYTDALRDLLDALDQNPSQDARNWALKRLRDLAPEARATEVPNQTPDQPENNHNSNNTPTSTVPTGPFTFQSSIAFPTEITDDASESETSDKEAATDIGKRRVLFESELAYKRRRRGQK